MPELTNDQKSKIYNEGVSAGKKHSVPSSNTIKFMAKMDTEINYIKDELKSQSEKIENLPTKTDLALAIAQSQKNTCDYVFEQSDKKYAGKLIEKVVYVITGAGGLWIINNLLELI
jgi:ATP-dependent helicase YprA (DUF1998 family)